MRKSMQFRNICGFYCGCLIFADILGLLRVLGILVEGSLVFSVVVVSGVRFSFSIDVAVVFSRLSVVAILVIVFSIVFIERSVVVFETTFVRSRSFFDHIPAIVSIVSVAFSVVILIVSRTSVVVSSRLLHLTFLTLLVLSLLLSFVGMITTFSWRSIAVIARMIALLISFLLWFFSGLSLLTSCSVFFSMSFSSSMCFSCMSVLEFNLWFNLSLLSMYFFLFVMLLMFILLLFVVMMMLLFLLFLLLNLLLFLMSMVMVMMGFSDFLSNDDGCVLWLRNNEDNSFLNFCNMSVMMDELLRRDGFSDFQLEVTKLASHISSQFSSSGGDSFYCGVVEEVLVSLIQFTMLSSLVSE